MVQIRRVKKKINGTEKYKLEFELYRNDEYIIGKMYKLLLRFEMEDEQV